MGAADLVAGLLAGSMLIASDHLAYPLAYSVFVVNGVWGPVAVGLLYRIHRPQSPVGITLIIFGFLNAITGL